jgi:hypothetical protein
VTGGRAATVPVVVGGHAAIARGGGDSAPQSSYGSGRGQRFH